MKKFFIGLIIFICFTSSVYAKRGCCSHHGGVAGCNNSGRTICSDGTLSPSCSCTPTVKNIYGCTDKSAKNYNSKATKNDGSCIYYIKGCTDKTAKNYNNKAEIDDGSCQYYIKGCTDKTAKNYNSDAELDDNSCEFDNNILLHHQDNTNLKEENSSSLPLGIGIAITFITVAVLRKKY